jgi:hypothetical protein
MAPSVTPPLPWAGKYLLAASYGVVSLEHTNVHPYDKRLTLLRDMTKLRWAGHGLRCRYVRLAVVLAATQACPATACVSCGREARVIQKNEILGGREQDHDYTPIAFCVQLTLSRELRVLP